MKRFVCAALMMPALVWAAAAASAAETDATPTKGEAELAKLLEGRVAGEAVRCIPARRQQNVKTIDGTAYVFGEGSTIWVQRTTRPQDIKGRNVLINQRFSGGEMCRMDLIKAVDPIAGFFFGGVVFEDFTPYTRVAQTASAEGARP